MKVRLLFIDRDKEDFDVICDILSEIAPDCECVWANNLEKGQELLQKFPPWHYVFCDCWFIRLGIDVQKVSDVVQISEQQKSTFVLYSADLSLLDFFETATGKRPPFLIKSHNIQELKQQLAGFFERTLKRRS